MHSGRILVYGCEVICIGVPVTMLCVNLARSACLGLRGARGRLRRDLQIEAHCAYKPTIPLLYILNLNNFLQIKSTPYL